MKGLFIINPNAGMRIFQSGAHDVAKHLAAAGLLTDWRFVYTQKGGDAFDATSKLSPREYDFVLTAGGDGTINETVNGLVTSDCGIPMLPLGAGTTNDFVTALGIGRTPATIEGLIKEYCVKDVDVGVCNGHYFINVTSGGVISAIAHSIPAEQKAQFGILAYYSVGLKELGEGNLPTSRIRFKTPEETFEESVFLLVVANSCQAGGFQNIAPRSKLDDGLFDVCIVRTLGHFDVLPIISLMQAGQHTNDKRIRYFQTSAISAELVDGDGPFMLDYDGESAGPMPLDVRMSDRKLKLIVPGRSLKVKKLFGS